MKKKSATKCERKFQYAMGLTTLIALSAVNMTVVAAGPSGYGSGSNAVPAIAQAYVIRMQEQVKKADEAALRGSQLMADGDYEGAIEQYRAALDLLPDAPMTEQRRRAYVKQFARASVLLARQRADEGRYNEAIAYVEDVLQPSMDPDNIDAKRLLEQLNDPDYYNPALTPQHLERVRKVKLALKTGQGYVDLGDYDRADREYNRVLTDDRYNKAARRGMENSERHKMDYMDVARNHTRARFLREVAQGWEMPIPVDIKGGDAPADMIPDTATTAIQNIETKLKTIIIPSLEFAETPLSEAISFLISRSQELDPTGEGVNIILPAGSGGGGAPVPAPGAPADGAPVFEGGGAAVGGGGGGGVGDTLITLRLANVPLAEALRYTTSLAQLKYKVEAHAVVVVPISTPIADLFTNTYVVPPTFLSTSPGGDGGGAAAGGGDPFAAPAEATGGVLGVRKTAKEILEGAGITFGTGASAIYSVANSSIIVRNTQDQMELVEAFVASLFGGVEKQVYVTSRFVEISEADNNELSFDWLLGAFNTGGGIIGHGGTRGNAAALPTGVTAVTPIPGFPAGVAPAAAPATAALRSGGAAISGDSIRALINGTGRNLTAAPAVFGISGVFSNPQFQLMISALSQKKGVDLLSAPSVMARSGQRAKIEIIREFIYPTEYDPPQIPNQIGSTGGVGVAGSTSFIPVTPATPTAFETRNTGITLEVDPVLGADEFTIDLNLAPEVVEFDGFINYGTPINGPIPALPAPQVPTVLTANIINMPVFNVRKVTTQVTIWDGQTVALGGLIREDIQDVQDKIPLFGDLPLVGRLFRSSVEQHLKRNLTIFVTAQIMDPSGLPIHGRIQDEPRPEPIPRPKVTAPAAFDSMPIPYQK